MKIALSILHSNPHAQCLITIHSEVFPSVKYYRFLPLSRSIPNSFRRETLRWSNMILRPTHIPNTRCAFCLFTSLQYIEEAKWLLTFHLDIFVSNTNLKMGLLLI